MTFSEELGNGNGLVDSALFCLEERELAGEVDGLELSRLSALSINNVELDLLASDVSDNQTEMGEAVEDIVGVDFLRKIKGELAC